MLFISVAFVILQVPALGQISTCDGCESAEDFSTLLQSKVIQEHSTLPRALISTNAITTELVNMKKSASSDGGIARIEEMVQTMEKGLANPLSSHRCDGKDPTDQATCSAQTTKTGCESVADPDGEQKCIYQMDGGSQDLEDLITNAKAAINQAVNTMLTDTETAYNNAKIDLKALDDAIDNSKQTISSMDLESIKTKATDWCTKKRALETASSDASSAASTLAAKLNAPLDLTDVLVKEVAGIGPSDCSKDNGNAKGSTCPATACGLAGRIASKVDTARAEYLAASWDKFEKDTAMSTATTEESASKGEFQTSVTVVANSYHSMCGSDDRVHDTAVTLFNHNNANRASTYRSLGAILCHINHMKSGETFDVPTKLLNSGETNPSTDATNCVGKLKSVEIIKADLFPDASSNEDSSKACATVGEYEADIRNYGSLGLDNDEMNWSPTTGNCDALTNHVAPGTSAPTPGVDDNAGNLKGHWDATKSASLTTDASGNVVVWNDLSTGGFNLATTADQTNYRPNLISDGINGHPAVDFSGSDYLASSIKHPTYENAPFTWIAVVQSDDGSSYDNIFSTNDAPKVTNSGYPYLPVSMATDREHGWSSTSDNHYTGGTVTTANLMVIITYTYTGLPTYSFNAWADKIGTTTLANKLVNNWNPSGNWGHYVHEGYVALGRGMQNGNHPFNGKIGEILTYNEALSEPELTTIVEGLKTKWQSSAE